MSELREIRVPDLGDVEEVEVIELLVEPGQRVEAEDGLLTLESEKASMDIPSPFGGRVKTLEVAVGAVVRQGDVIAVLEVDEANSGKEETARVPEGPPAVASERDSGVPSAAERGAGPEPDDVSDGDGGAPTPVAGSDGGQAESAPQAEPDSALSEPSESSEGTDSDPRAPRASASGEPGFAAAGEDAYDVVVVGSGPGGYTAAFRAADLGLRVALVERYPTLGGVCLNVGCIPSKALLHAARVIEEAAAFADHGIRFGPPEIDVDALRAWKEEVVSKPVGGLATMAKQRGVSIIQGTARLVSRHELEVEAAADGRRLRFDKAILAPGSRVIEIPGIPYDDGRVVDSTGALELPDVPAKLLVVGGGIIGLEMATVYGALGSEVTIVEMLDGLIPGCDRDLVRPLQRRLETRFGAAVHLGVKVSEVKAQKNGLKAVFEGGSAPGPKIFDRVLVAVGRRPNGDRVGAEAAGVTVDARGFIPVDRQQRTNVDNLFAIGDVVGQPMLAHKASHEGKVAAEVCAGQRSSFDARVIPSVAYTDPEVAWVGLTETAAEEEGVAYEKAVFPWAASARAQGIGRPEGSTKLLFDPETKRLLGAGIVGVGAGDLISELALALEMDCEAGDVALTIHPHPTLSESIAMAAEVFEGTVTDLYLRRGKRG